MSMLCTMVVSKHMKVALRAVIGISNQLEIGKSNICPLWVWVGVNSVVFIVWGLRIGMWSMVVFDGIQSCGFSSMGFTATR